MRAWNRRLLALLALQVGLVWWAHRDTREDPGSVPALPQVAADSVTALEVSDGETTLRLERQGDTWILPDAGEVPAREGQVESIVERLVALKLERPIARQATSHTQLNVASDNASRRVVVESGEQRTTLLLGRSQSGFNVMHLRRADDDAVYRIEEFTEWDFTPRNSSWVDTRVFDKRKGDLWLFRLQTRDDIFEFTRDDEDTWHFAGPVPEGQTFDETGFGIWLNQQGSWLLADVVGLEIKPEYGLESPTVRLDFEVEVSREVPDPEAEPGDDGQRPTKRITEKERKSLLIGSSREGQGDWYATFTGDDRVFTVADHRVQDLLKRDRASFFKATDN